MYKDLELNERNRLVFINKVVAGIKLVDEMMVDVIVQYTTYDSTSAWCMDGNEVIATHVPASKIKEIVQDYFADNYDFSNINIIQDTNNYAYGYSVTIVPRLT